MAELPPLREVIAAHDLQAKKSLGQNFLLDANLLAKIVRLAGIAGGDRVYEVGPGPGGLTRALLAAGAHVVAVEQDARAIAALQSLRETYADRLVLHHGDALQLDEASFGCAHIVANLPYNIGTALLVRWLSGEAWPPWWQSLTLMFQKEVAERIVALPGSEAYGRLAVLVGWRAQARILMTVPREAFTPPPKVTSAVIHIRPHAPLAPIRARALERVTAAAFGQRRKMLRSSLKGLVQKPETLLEAAGIDGARRAETLNLSEFVALAGALDQAATG
jgi:16S rRNA (adenine1518-N6/adenine1519-N6)-dimethyltransferase